MRRVYQFAKNVWQVCVSRRTNVNAISDIMEMTVPMVRYYLVNIREVFNFKSLIMLKTSLFIFNY